METSTKGRIEVLDVSQRFSLSNIANISIENIPVEPESTQINV